MFCNLPRLTAVRVHEPYLGLRVFLIASVHGERQQFSVGRPRQVRNAFVAAGKLPRGCRRSRGRYDPKLRDIFPRRILVFVHYVFGHQISNTRSIRRNPWGTHSRDPQAFRCAKQFLAILAPCGRCFLARRILPSACSKRRHKNRRNQKYAQPFRHVIPSHRKTVSPRKHLYHSFATPRSILATSCPRKEFASVPGFCSGRFFFGTGRCSFTILAAERSLGPRGWHDGPAESLRTSQRGRERGWYWRKSKTQPAAFPRPAAAKHAPQPAQPPYQAQGRRISSRGSVAAPAR